MFSEERHLLWSSSVSKCHGSETLAIYGGKLCSPKFQSIIPPWLVMCSYKDAAFEHHTYSQSMFLVCLLSYPVAGLTEGCTWSLFLKIETCLLVANRMKKLSTSPIMNFIHLRKMVLLHQANEATLVIRKVANSPPLTNFEPLAARKWVLILRKENFVFLPLFLHVFS